MPKGTLGVQDLLQAQLQPAMPMFLAFVSLHDVLEDLAQLIRRLFQLLLDGVDAVSLVFLLRMSTTRTTQRKMEPERSGTSEQTVSACFRGVTLSSF